MKLHGRPYLPVAGACLIAALTATIGAAEPQKEFLELSLEELLSIQVVTASKIPESWAGASSTTTVITSADIRNQNPESLYELLRAVPGISVDYDGRGMPGINIRGFNQSPVLYLLNGHSLSGVVSGDAKNTGLVYLPVNNIKQIEVVRGPGSALYGANALIGIVSITTFSGDDLNAVRLAVDGNFEREGFYGKRFTLEAGHSLSAGSYSVNLQRYESDGPAQVVRADSDGRSGQVDNSLEATDLQANLNLGSLSVFTRFNHYRRDDFLGLTDYLHDHGSESTDSRYLSAEWQEKVMPRWELAINGYYDDRDVDWLWNFFPPGSAVTAPGAPLEAWQETGLISNLLWKESKTGVDISNIYQASDNHTLVAGVAAERQRSYDIRHIANQNPDFLPALSDVSATYNWNQPATRDIKALYLQDTWQILPTLRSNLGARLDNYSDFGTTTNPRLALIWDAHQDHNLKLLYGEAFRAPDFGDLYAENLFGSNGNPDIQPEKVKTLEMSLSSDFGSKIVTRLTLFQSEMTDLIVPGEISMNRGHNDTRGVESEARYEFARDSYLSANYTFSDASQNDSEFPESPRHKGNVQLNWSFSHQLNVNLSGYFQTDASTRTGGKNSGYSLWSASLLANSIVTGLDLKLSVRNLLDKQYSYPGRFIMAGYPAPGRTVQVGLTYHFSH